MSQHSETHSRSQSIIIIILISLFSTIWDRLPDSFCGPQYNDVMKWKHFPRYWPFMRGISRSSVNSPHKGQWRGALMLSLLCAWTDSWTNNGCAGDLRRHRAHYDVIKWDVVVPPLLSLWKLKWHIQRFSVCYENSRLYKREIHFSRFYTCSAIGLNWDVVNVQLVRTLKPSSE